MDVSVNSCCCELSFRDSLVIGFPCLFAIQVVRFYHTSVAEYVEAYTSPQKKLQPSLAAYCDFNYNIDISKVNSLFRVSSCHNDISSLSILVAVI